MARSSRIAESCPSATPFPASGKTVAAEFVFSLLAGAGVAPCATGRNGRVTAKFDGADDAGVRAETEA